jgi:hypothetical protein
VGSLFDVHCVFLYVLIAFVVLISIFLRF